MGKGWESNIILPELGRLKWEDYYTTDILYRKIYSRYTTLCDLKVVFDHKGREHLNSIILKDFWPWADECGNLIKLPVKKAFTEKYDFVTDFKAGDEIKHINWVCSCFNKNYIILN